MANVAVIGAGAMGLAAAYHALKSGHTVEVFEADSIAGGMAAHFDFDGVSIERFYHFICKSDAPTFALMDELGIGDKVKWRDTSMGYFVDGQHHDWGTPIALLKFPHLSWLSKLRYGLQMFLATKRSDWTALDKQTSKDWLINTGGKQAFEVLWRRLFELKFYELADNISAAWLWTRIKRVGTSRSSILQETLGYIEGGSETLVAALVRAIESRGGRIHLGARVSEYRSENGHIVGVIVDDVLRPADAVISTVPTPLISQLVPAFSKAVNDRYDAIKNVGVVCVVLKLKRSVTRHFWLNVNDPRMEIPGLVEFSNLRPLAETIVYIPYYMPRTNPKFRQSDASFVAEAWTILKALNPALQDRDLSACRVGRLAHAQPVCEPNFLAKLPSVQTPIVGLQIADTCYYYPEDRGIAESVRYGQLMADAVTRPQLWKELGR